MSRHTWIRRLFSPRPATARKNAHNRTRIAFDSLEDRTVPAVIDVSGALASGTSTDGNVIMSHVEDTFSTGSGVITPFLRVHNQDVEQGYNTSWRQGGNDSELLDDIQNLPFTHDLPLAAVPIVTIGGVLYRQFTLDLGEPGNDTSTSGQINLDRLMFFTSANAQEHLTGSTWPGSIPGTTLRYDLATSDGDTFVLRDLSSGNGKTDYAFYVKDSVFAGTSSNDFLYMYCQFGNPPPTADGTFEEFGTTTPVTKIPTSITTEVELGANDTNESVVSGPVPFNSVVHDSAVVSHAGSPIATGTVTYTLYDTHGTLTTSDDTTVGSPHTVTLNPNGTVPESFTAGGADGPLGAGDYYYVAAYSGDAQYASSVGDHENFTVNAQVHINSLMTFQGTKFEDINGNGAQDPGEPGIAGWHITITTESGAHDVATNSAGLYEYTENLTIGSSYSVSEVQQGGWQETLDGSTSGTVPASDDAVIANFGNHAIATISIDKTANPTSVSEGVGNQDVTYTYLVTQANAGHTGLVVTVSDTDGPPQPTYVSGDTNNDGLLQNTETWTYTLTVTMTPQNAGATHTNTATATGKDGTNTTTDTDDATVTYTDVAPSVTIAKSHTGTINEGTAGQTLTYSFTVTNTSTASTDPLTVTALSDNVLGDLLPAFLAANGGSDVIPFGGSVTFSVTYNVPVANANAVIANTVTVKAHDDDTGNLVSASDSDSVTYQDVAPSVTIAKSANVTSVNVGGSVTYTYTVTNTSLATTDPVTLTSLVDDKIGDLLADFKAANGGSATLAYGASVTFTKTVTMPTSGTTVTNTVDVTGTDDEGDVATAEASATVTLTFTISGTKFLDHNGAGNLTKTANNDYLGGFTIKLYTDANGNGTYDAGIDTLVGTKTTATGTGGYSFSGLNFGKTYFVVEDASTQTDPANWIQSGGGNNGHNYYTDVANVSQDFGPANFANVHLGKNQGLTIGYYSNKNGQATITAADLTYLQSLNLRNANGTAFDPTTAKQVGDYLTSASATNMANMLSAQLIATVLNVRHGLVTSSAVYVGPGNQMGAFNTEGSNLVPNLNSHGALTYGAGFVNINALINAANTELGTFATSTASVNSGERAYMEAMKDVFDAINNNVNFFVL